MQFLFGMADRRVSKRALRSLGVLEGALSTRRAWRAIVVLDLYTRNRLLEFMESKQQTSSLFCGFLPNPFIQDLFL